MGLLIAQEQAANPEAAVIPMARGDGYPEWQRRLDKLSGRRPGTRRVISLDQWIAEEGTAYG